MAATKTAAAGSKKRASRNDTPNTPDVSESRIARMKVGELRRELDNRGVRGTADLKKPDLVKKLIKAEKKSSSSKAKNPTSRNDTPDTPEVSESRIAAMKASSLRTQLTKLGVKGTGDMKKAELVERYVKARLKLAKAGTGSKAGAASKRGSGSKASAASAKSSASKSSTASKSSPASKAGAASKSSPASKAGAASKSGTAQKAGGKRTGKKTSKSLDYSQEITSTSDKPERNGRSLITTDHEVIRQWAKARRAVPSTVAGTQHDGHLGVLRFDFPGYSGDGLVEVSWAEWFEAFDKRRLNFIYQERRSGGERSNFFQLDNPDE
ncbi:hypothetical protein [Paractinoplanes hotanensis]|uniref:Rho termination factor N-terminal domain-containing protein n=1 Tax=Paractinoplanes hotanensis TaxID=2906497 RepID=A0ABT0XTZ1_9ACTN|nr:hypothetical protein [Actinoplanes hotanensis]MCM4077202.1 hypothetical protein [Actinoplanes hotanensis]